MEEEPGRDKDQPVSGWMAISARNRSTGRHRLEGRSQIFCLRLTAHMENLITFRVSAGEEMQDMPPALKWESHVQLLGTDPEQGICKTDFRYRDRKEGCL